MVGGEMMGLRGEGGAEVEVEEWRAHAGRLIDGSRRVLRGWLPQLQLG